MVPTGCDIGTQAIYLIGFDWLFPNFFNFFKVHFFTLFTLSKFTTTALPPPPSCPHISTTGYLAVLCQTTFPTSDYLRPYVFEQRVHGDTISGAYEIICLSGQLSVRVAAQVRLFLPWGRVRLRCRCRWSEVVTRDVWLTESDWLAGAIATYIRDHNVALGRVWSRETCLSAVSPCIICQIWP